MGKSPSGAPKLRNMGPVCGEELRRIGIGTREKLLALGWRSAFQFWVGAHPERLNLNALSGLIGAAEDVDWREILPQTKAQAREFLDQLRRELPSERGRSKRRPE